MNNPPFFRPMLAGFAVTAGAMLILPIRAEADGVAGPPIAAATQVPDLPAATPSRAAPRERR